MSDTISAEPVAGVAFESVVPVEKPLQIDLSFMPELLEVDLLVRAAEARAKRNGASAPRSDAHLEACSPPEAIRSRVAAGGH
ncbi:hypothetical protein ACTWPB_27965 [Nocardia sp. IBHARD005]|uniref:hypothetical protein n=1 Tax=Nocardia sp. IBHARD005 TaxID=3457765 RepID=UPI004058084B